MSKLIIVDGGAHDGLFASTRGVVTCAYHRFVFNVFPRWHADGVCDWNHLDVFTIEYIAVRSKPKLVAPAISNLSSYSYSCLFC